MKPLTGVENKFLSDGADNLRWDQPPFKSDPNETSCSGFWLTFIRGSIPGIEPALRPCFHSEITRPLGRF